MDTSKFLIKEYENLQNEYKKKYSSLLKQSNIKNALKVLDDKGKLKLAEKGEEDISETLICPMQTAFENKAYKLYSIALHVLVKICMTQLLNQELAFKIMKSLNAISISDMKDEMMQISWLQICMAWLSSNWIIDPKKDFIESSMKRLLSLYEVKSKAVSSTSKAAMLQLFSHVFSKLSNWAIEEQKNETSAKNIEEEKAESPKKDVKNEQKNKENSSTSNQRILEICTKLLSDLVSHLSPDKESEWQVQNNNNSTTCLALDLLSLIITEWKGVLSHYPKLMIILDEVFDPLLSQMTSMKSDYGVSIRLINWITSFVIYIEWGLEPLTRWWLTFINIKSNSWQKLIALEAFSLIFKSENLVKNLSESNEQWWLSNILKVFEQYLSSITPPLDDDIFGNNSSSYHSQKLNKYLEDKNFDSVIPVPEHPVLVKLLIECLFNISIQFINLAEAKFSNSTKDSSKMDKLEFQQKIFNSHHLNTFLSVLSFCLYLWNDEINIQSILNTYQNLFSIAGKVDNSRTKVTILNALGKSTLPKYYEKLSIKNILVIKMIFNISHWLSKYLDSKWWYSIFKIMQKIEPLVRDELGLQSADEEYGHQLINLELKKEWGVHKASKVNQTFSEFSQYGRIRGINAKRKLSHDEEENKDDRFQVNNSFKKSKAIQQPKSSLGRRKTATNKVEGDDNDFNPIGRSKTISGQQKTQTDWHDEPNLKELNRIDLDQINTSISTLFISTLQYPDELVKEMIAGLGELIVNNIEEMSESPNSTASKTIDSHLESASLKGKRNLFSLRKLIEIVLINIYRVEYFWQTVIDQLMVISVCNNQDFRSLALEAWMIIIIEIIQKRESQDIVNRAKITKKKSDKKENIEEIKSEESDTSENEKSSPQFKRPLVLSADIVDSPDEDHKLPKIILPKEEDIDWNDDDWQVKVLKPFWDSINNTSYEQDLLKIVNHIQLIIDKCSSSINKEGWTVIVISLCSVNLKLVNSEVYHVLFKLITTIVSNYANQDNEHQDNKVRIDNLQTVILSLNKFLSYNQGKTKWIIREPLEIDVDKNYSSEELEEFDLIVKIARVLEQHIESYHEEDVSNEDLVYSLFEQIKLVYNKLESNPMKRRLIVKALQQIIVHYSENWNSELWEFVLENVFLSFFDKSVLMYIDHLVGFSTTKAREVKKTENFQAMQTPTFSFGGPEVGQSSKKGGKKKDNRRMRFDEESIQKFNEKHLKENNDGFGFGIPPEETPKAFKPSKGSIEEQNLCLYIMEVFNDAYLNSELNSDKISLNIFIEYVKQMIRFISHASAEILKGVLKTIILILESDHNEILFRKYDSVTLGLFEEINNVIQRKTDLVLTVENTELLVNWYKNIFKSENLEKYPQIMNPQNLNVAFHVLKINLMNARPTIGLNAMRAENELKNEEKMIFDFIEQLGHLLKENEDAIKYFLSYLLNFISYDPEEPHYETFVRRVFLIISDWIVADDFNTGVLYDLIPELYNKSCQMINLRYQNTAWMSLIFSMKNNSSLFETAGMFLLQISSHLLDKEEKESEEGEEEKEIEDKFEEKIVEVAPVKPQQTFKKPFLQIEIPEDGEGEDQTDSARDDQNNEGKDSDEEENVEANIFKDVKKSQPEKLRVIDEEESMVLSPGKLRRPTGITLTSVQDLLLNKIMDSLKDTLLFDIRRIENHNKAVKDAVIKSSQNLDVQIYNFIINALLPHADRIGKKFEHALVSIIDQGCNGYLDAMSSSGMNVLSSSSTLLGQSNSLSNYWFDNLFELCTYKQVKPNKYGEGSKTKKKKLEDIKRRIAKTTVPILIDRCKDTLNKFIYDHGFSTMSLMRVEEAIFILNKLKHLEIYPNVLCDLVSDEKKMDESKNQQWSEEQLDFRHHCLKGTKAHLFILLPLFSDLITSKEEMIKEPLKDIFLEIGKASAINEQTKLNSSKGPNGEISLF